MEDNKFEELEQPDPEIERENELIEKRLELAPLKKARFLIAIGKKEENLEYITAPCESIKHVLNRMCLIGSNKDTVWEDSIVINKFNSWKRPDFEMDQYLRCVRWIYLAYFGLRRSDFLAISNFSNAMMYVLAHARNFTEPQRELFQFSATGDKETLAAPPLDEMETEFPTNTPYAAAINECLTQLSSNESLDEEVYQRLNANITYLILLMMRRAVKTQDEFRKSFTRPETHANYLKLCPHPLHDELPDISDHLNEDLMSIIEFSSLKQLIMVAVTQCEDEKTVQILKVTCLQHLEWTGLVFPRMFFKVAKLYGVSEDTFWDIMSNNITLSSLFELSDLYFHQYKVMKEDPSKSFKLFPYCRLFGSDYHRGMSYRTHYAVCYILVYLHDLHFGLDKSSARLAHWTKNKTYQTLSEPLAKCALAIHKKYFVK